MICQVPLYGKYGLGKFTLIDEEDYELVGQYRWLVTPDGYAVTASNKLRLHRLILATPLGMFTDHINHDRLDNRRENLRVVTLAQNIKNNRPFAGSGFKGVYFYQNRYHARITANSKGHYLGGFKDPEDAARAYNVAAIEYFGDYAYLNPVKGVLA